MAEPVPSSTPEAWWSALAWPTRILVGWVGLHIALQALLPVLLARKVYPASAHVRGLLLELSQGRDSWYAMLPAYLHLAQGEAGRLYTEVFFDQEIKFQYPPTSLLPLAAFDAAGFDQPAWHLAFTGISYAMTLLAAGALIALLIGCLGQAAAGPRVPPRGERWIIAACALGAALTFYPLTKGVSNGNVHLWISALTIAAMACWVYGRARWAGVALGLAALLKPHFAAFLLWGLVRRQWGFATAAAAALALGLGASIARFGGASHLAYLDTVRFMARHGEAVATNQSFLGLLHRVRDGRSLAWHFDMFAPFRPWLYEASVAFAAVLLLLALALPARGGKAGGPLDLGIMILTVTLASPIAWHAHYGTLLAVFPIVFAMGVARGRLGRLEGAALAAAYLALANAWAFDLTTPSTPWNGFHSEVFAPALLLLALCYWRVLGNRIAE